VRSNRAFYVSALQARPRPSATQLRRAPLAVRQPSVGYAFATRVFGLEPGVRRSRARDSPSRGVGRAEWRSKG
jgi:hypothetical protein